MKLLIEMIVSSQTEWKVIGGENAPQATIRSRGNFSFGESGEFIVNGDEISYTSVLEVCETSLLDFTVKGAGIYGFYHKRLEKSGINPLTFGSS